MIDITEHTETRLVLRDRRRGFRALAAAFTMVSACSVSLLAYNGYQSLILNSSRLDAARIAVLMLFLTIGMLFVGAGLFVIANMSRDIVITLDRDAETVSVSGPRLLRPIMFQHSIYAVLQMRVEENPEMRAYGLYLVLRSGEQIPLTVVPVYAREHVDQLVYAVRGFLRGM
jgi:hypothetical protein